jgi:superfamily I DNA/RNA helicase
MPTIVMTKVASKLDPSVKKKAYTFLEKLAEDDSLPGLHIEPINHSADPRVRTGRVDQFYRAVLFKIPNGGDTTYVFHGIWPHDDAIGVAKTTVLRVNPVNGVTEIRTVRPDLAPAPTPGPKSTPTQVPAPPAPTPAPTPMPAPEAVPAPVPDPETVATPLLQGHGITADILTDQLGIDPDLAQRALAARDDDQLLAVATDVVEWQGLVLLDLASGHPVAEVEDKYQLRRPAEHLTQPAASDDEELVRGLQRPAAQISFTYIDGSEELRRVIEGGDFGAWRVFLHPEQRAYAQRRYNGPFRLSGGAGTGKTVVVLHRARTLARRTPQARILLTTFTTNLAEALRTDLRRLDPGLAVADRLGDPGIHVTGIDALASAVLRQHRDDLDPDIEAVLGAGGVQLSGRMTVNPWRDALDAAGSALPENLRSEAFLSTEYATIVLPHRITTREQYLKVRRPGRGVALDRAKRGAVWDVITAARAAARVRGSIDFVEASAIAAAHLERTAASRGRLYDYVLVDEAQDLAPTHWQLLRALVDEDADDLFIAEDSHQRIYGRRVVLGQYGIRIVGRSRRLTLNYRTTAQNLHYALRILQGADYLDLEETADTVRDYRSARTGPTPRVLPCPSISSELDTAAAIITDWAGATTAPETIAVLVRDRWQRDRVAAGLAERGVQIRAVDREPIKPGNPVVLTMHRAKGTEFSCVLLFGISSDSIPAAMREQRYSDDAWADALLRERSLVYVAATRARDELAVTWTGKPSTLLGAGI